MQDIVGLKPLYDSIKEEEKMKKPKECRAPEEEDDTNKMVEKRIPEVVERFEECYDSVMKYNDQLTNVLPSEGTYHYTLLKFVPWIDEAEKKLEDIKRESIKVSPQEPLAVKVKEFENDITRNEPTHKEFNSSADDLFEKCTETGVSRDVPFIKDEVQQTNDRWEKLKAGFDDVNRNSAELDKLLKDFEGAVQPVEECIEAMQESVQHEPPMDFDLDSLEHYTNELDSDVETMQEREPQLEDVAEKCNDVVSFLNEHEADPSEIQQRGADVDKGWKETKDKLTEKLNDAKKALKHLKQFTASIDDLDDWVNVTTATVTNLGPASPTTEGVQKQIEQIDAVQEQITKQKVKLTEADRLGDWLTDENKDNPQFCADVQNKLNKVDQPLEVLRELLADKKKKLYDALAANQDFNTALEEFISELDKLDQKQAKSKPLTVEWSPLKSLDDEQKVMEKDIEILQPLVEKLTEAGEKVLKESEKSPERDALEERLNDSKKRFEKNNDEIIKCRAKLDKIMPKSEKFNNLNDDICDWLDKEEKIVDDLPVAPVTLDDVTKIEKAIQKLEKDIAAEKPVYEDTMKSSEELLNEAAKEDVIEHVPETVKETEVVKKRWDDLQKGLDNKKDLLVRYRDLITTYTTSVEPLKSALTQFEDALDTHPSFGIDSKKAVEELDRVKELLDELNAQEPQKKVVDKTSQEMVGLLNDNKGDSSPVEASTNTINDRIAKARSKLAERKDSLEEVSRVLSHFNGIAQDVEDWCEEVQKECSELGPVSKDPEEAKKQLQKIEVSFRFVQPILHYRCESVF